jgi:hypothetical protein
MTTAAIEYEIWTVTFNGGHQQRYRDGEAAAAAVAAHDGWTISDPVIVRHPIHRMGTNSGGGPITPIHTNGSQA